MQSSADPTTKFLTPIVIAGVILVVGFAVALAIVDTAQTWKAAVAGAFIAVSVLFCLSMKGQRRKASGSTRNIRAAFIVASLMIASQLAFAVAKVTGWFGEDGNPERWSFQWFLVALTAAAIEVLGFNDEKKPDQKDPD